MKALEWQIPVVNLQWLFNTVKSAHLQVPKDYLAAASQLMDADVAPITDITNSEGTQAPTRSSHSSSGSDGRREDSPSKLKEFKSQNEWVPNDLLFENPSPAPASSPSKKLATLVINSSPRTPSRLLHQPTEVVPDSREPSPFKARDRSSSSTERVPSSATPSPLKMTTTICDPSAAPMQTSLASTTTLSEGSATALKDALASLLGKRTSSSEEHTSEGGGGSDLPNRVAKRAKAPPRTKNRTFSRTGSVSELGMGRTGSSLSAGEYPLSEGLQTPADLAIESLTEEDSFRVTYEDPSQRAEEERLQRLFSAAAGRVGDSPNSADPLSDLSTVELGLDKERKRLDEAEPKRRGKNLVRRTTRQAETV